MKIPIYQIDTWQCQKKLYLDKHHRDLAEDSDDRQAIFDAAIQGWEGRTVLHVSKAIAWCSG